MFPRIDRLIQNSRIEGLERLVVCIYPAHRGYNLYKLWLKSVDWRNVASRLKLLAIPTIRILTCDLKSLLFWTIEWQVAGSSADRDGERSSSNRGAADQAFLNFPQLHGQKPCLDDLS